MDVEFGEYGCLLFDAPVVLATRALAYALTIKDADLAGDGRELHPHITLVFGLHDLPVEKIRKACESLRPMTVTLKGIGYFPASESGASDVLKIDVESDDLQKAHAAITRDLPNTQTHPAYQPHLTLAYVQPGCGIKYMDAHLFSDETHTLSELTYSNPSHDLTRLPLTGRLWVYTCPKCNGDAYTGDPETGTRYRGSARCSKCGHGFSAIHRKPKSKLGPIIKKAKFTDDHWKDQTRAPEGAPGGGRWVKGATTPAGDHPGEQPGPFKKMDLDVGTLELFRQHMGPDAKAETMGRLAGGLPGGTFYTALTRKPNEIQVNYYHKQHGLRIQARIIFSPSGDHKIYNDLIAIGNDKQTSGIGTRLLASQVEHAVKHGFNRLEALCAGWAGDETMNGYYTWPRLGYDGPVTPSQADRLGFPGVTRLHDLFAKPGGPEAWKQHGRSFAGTFDLTNGSRSRAVLRAYAQRKGLHVEFLDNLDLSPTDERILDEIWAEIQDLGWDAFCQSDFTGDGWKKQIRSPKGSPGGGRWAKQGAATEHEPHPKTDELFGPSKAKTSIDYDGYWPRHHRDDPSDHAGYEKEIMGILHGMFGKKFTLQDVASVVGAPDDAKVTVERRWDTIRVIVRHANFGATRHIQMDEDSKTVFINNNFFTVDPDKQKAGLGTRIFGRQVEQAKKHGVAYIKCVASRDEDNQNGYYTWPRLGYDASLKDLAKDQVAKQASKRFPKAKTVLDVMQTASGRAWWKEHGCTLLPAVFDLSHGSRSLTVLNAYLDERRKTNRAFSADQPDFTGDNWRNQERNPKGSEGGGRWAKQNTSPITAHEPHLPEAKAEPGFKSVNVSPRSRLEINRCLGEHVTDDDMGRLIGALPGTKVWVNFYEPGELHATFSGKGVYAERDLHLGQSPQDRWIKNELTEIDESMHGQGIGTRILTTQVSQAVKLGFSRLDNVAVGDPPLPGQKQMHVSGYYAWARMGYDGAIRQELSDRMPPPFSEATTIHEIMSMKGGPEMWKRRGSWFYGTFDLAEGSRSRGILRAYAQRKGIAATFSDGVDPWLSEEDERIFDEVWQLIQDRGWRELGVSETHFAGGDHWKDQARAPKGSNGGGRWVKKAGGLSSMTERFLGKKEKLVSDAESVSHRALVKDTFEKGLNGLAPAVADAYRQSYEHVLNRMPDTAMQRLHANLHSVHFHPDIAAINRQWNKESPQYPVTKQQIAGFCVSDPHVKGQIMHLDSGSSRGMTAHEARINYYSHEIGHILDGGHYQGNMLSRQPDWRAAWREEINHLHNPLSKYARLSEREGFAEYYRLVHANPQTAEKTFPACWRVFAKNKLV